MNLKPIKEQPRLMQPVTIRAPENIELYVTAGSVSIVLVDSKGRRHYTEVPMSEIAQQWTVDLRNKLAAGVKKGGRRT